MDGTAYQVPEPEKTVFAAIEEGAVLLGIRPQHIVMTEGGGSGLRGRIKAVEPMGREVLFHVDVSGKDILVLRENPDFTRGDRVRLDFEPGGIRIYEAPSQRP